MKQRALFTLGQGDWQRGFASVAVQLWDGDGGTPIQFSGSLPAAPDLYRDFQRWRSLYVALYGDSGIWRRAEPTDVTSAPSGRAIPSEAFSRSWSEDAAPHRSAADPALSSGGFPIDVDDDDITHVSAAEFSQLGETLRQQLNSWLESPSFRPVDRQLRTHLSRGDEIRVIIAAETPEVMRYPWQLWQLFEDYPYSELALSPINYQRSVKTPRAAAHENVSVLAVLGNAHGIDVATDQRLLSALPGAVVTVLPEPSLDELHQQLWHGSWDILFFAGHSSSQDQGVLQLNRTDSISLVQLRYALRTAIAQGLQLAIFNSCDGLGLAWDLADLHIPQVIVMREPVPDGVAHAFLTHFLTAFAAGQPLYLAVRAAREQLQPLEPLCPCATWLPAIVQNPAELPTSWNDLRGISQPEVAMSPTVSRTMPSAATPSAATALPLARHSRWRWFSRANRLTLLVPLLATVTVVTLRLLGTLMPIELFAFDRLMQLRPAERPDDRFLVVTLGEADIRAQTAERRGSLSDAALDRLLISLDQHRARLVGLDIYRDYPVSPDYPNLAARLQTSDRFVGVCKSRDPTVDPLGVDPPPELPENLVGFSDFLDDPDGIMRRHLVSLDADPTATCTTPYAFSARLAFLYLQDHGITPSFDDRGNLVMGDAVFPRLRSRSGGYQPIDAGGTQIMLNYRALNMPSAIADQVSLTQLLSGQVNPEAIANRIVLIGVTASSVTDDWATPYGASSGDKTAGVFLQAQMTSQLISAALGERPVLSALPIWLDVLWIGGWALGGWTLAVAVSPQRGRVSWGIVLVSLGLVVLTGGSLWLLVAGYWVPLVPAGLALVGSSLGTLSRCRLA